MSKLIQVDFYPNGRIVKHFEGEFSGCEVSHVIRGKTPKEQLKERLKDYKRRKQNEQTR